MKDEKKRSILFVFHDAGLTGANLVLFRYISFLFQHHQFNLSFIVGRPGPLINALSPFGPICIVDHQAASPGLLARVLRKLFKAGTNKDSKWKPLDLFTIKQKPDLIYCNTVLSIPFIQNVFSRKKFNILLHFHELELAYNLLNQDLSSVLKEISFFIATSESTSTFILNKFNIKKEKISVHYPPLPEKFKEAEDVEIKGLKQERFIIGSSGTGIGRKGVFHFIQLAAALKNKTESMNFQFIWVGSIKLNKEEIMYDLIKLGLENDVVFTGEVNNPMDFYKKFNLFVSLSKEESFGLACAEAASLGIPLCGFKNTGGGEELIESTGGILIPYLDINAMADSIILLSGEKEKLFALKEQSKKATEKYFPVNIGPEWVKTISQQIISN